MYKKLNKIHDELDSGLEYKTISEFNKTDSSKNKHISKNNSLNFQISENIALKIVVNLKYLSLIWP